MKNTKTDAEIKDELFEVMTAYYRASAKAVSLDKELKKARAEENAAYIKYNAYLAGLEQHYGKNA